MAHALIALSATPLAFHALCLSVCERMFSIGVVGFSDGDMSQQLAFKC